MFATEHIPLGARIHAPSLMELVHELDSDWPQLSEKKALEAMPKACFQPLHDETYFVRVESESDVKENESIGQGLNHRRCIREFTLANVTVGETRSVSQLRDQVADLYPNLPRLSCRKFRELALSECFEVDISPYRIGFLVLKRSRVTEDDLELMNALKEWAQTIPAGRRDSEQSFYNDWTLSSGSRYEMSQSIFVATISRYWFSDSSSKQDSTDQERFLIRL